MPITIEGILWNFLGVAVALLAIGYTYFRRSYQYWKKKNMPYLEPSIPFGNMSNPIIITRGPADGIRRMYNEAKSKGYRHCGIYNFTAPTYLPLDLELIKHVMTKDFGHFIDRGIYYNEKDDPISAHLFAIGGKKWRNLRVKLTPSFTSGKLKAMFQTLVDCGLVMEEYIEKNINNTEAVDIKEILSRFSTDIIGSCAFGLECNTFKDPNSPFRENAKRMFSRNLLRTIVVAFAQNFPDLGRALGIRVMRKEISDFYTEVVEDTVNYRVKNNYRRKDLLQLMIDLMAKREGNDDGYTGDGNTLTMNEIVAQCFLFFIAGFETSSTTMTFALFQLASNPDIQDKVREEINTVLAKHNNEITYDSLSELKYMRQVIDETLRLYPAVPVVTRMSVEDYKVPGEDVVIDKGTRVFIPIVGLHYDKEYFPNPEVFDPDRFNEENKKKIPQYAHIPFGEGPRVCIGERFGVMQTKVGLACLLRNFRVTLNEKTQLPMKLDPKAFIPAAQGGIWVNLEKL